MGIFVILISHYIFCYDNAQHATRKFLDIMGYYGVDLTTMQFRLRRNKVTMRILYILILVLSGITVYGQIPELPEYEGTQPVWHHIVKDEIREGKGITGFFTRAIVDNGFMYYSISLDTTIVTSEVENYKDPAGFLLQRYDLSDGTLNWSNQYEYPYTLDSIEHHDRLVQDKDGNIVLFGIQLIEKKNKNTTLYLGSAKASVSFVTRKFDPESGELLAKVVGKDSIRNPFVTNWRNHYMDIDRRVLLNNRLFGYNKFFGFGIVPYDENNNIDSSGIAEFREYLTDTTYYISHPRINYIKDGFMKLAVDQYVFDDNNIVYYKKSTYYELDYRDIYDVKIVNTFDVSGRLADLPTNPIQNFTYYEFGEEVMYSTHIHYTDGNHGAWIAWYDYEGNYLGGHDYINVEYEEDGEVKYEPMYFTFKNMIIDDRFYTIQFLGDKRNEFILTELSPDFLPKEIGRVKCANFNRILKNFSTYYDSKNHQVIYTSLIDDPETESENYYNYIAAFDADDLGIERPSVGTKEIILEELKVYPNPVIDRVTIDLGQRSFTGLLQIFDISGKTIYAQRVSFEGKYEVDISDAPSGTYQVKLLSEDTAYEVKEIIKIH